MTADERDTLARFEDEVIDRLFVLNEKRFEEEQVKGLGSGGRSKPSTRKRNSSKLEGQLKFDR